MSPISSCFVTGAATPLGVSIIKTLRAQNLDVTCLVNTENRNIHIERLFNLGGKIIEGDVKDIQTYGNSIKGIDCVIHLDDLKFGSEHELIQHNVDGTKRLISTLSEGTVVIFPSTLGVYNVSSGVVHEGTETKPSDIYSRTKRLAENLLIKSDKTVSIIMRLPSIIGPSTGEVGVHLKRIFSRRVVPRCTDMRYAFLHESDLLDYIITSLSHELHETVTINAIGDYLSCDELYEAYIMGSGDDGWKLRIPEWLMGNPLRNLNPYLIGFNNSVEFDLSLAETELSWVPDYTKKSIFEELVSIIETL